MWQNAHRFSLAHDVSDGGPELALREAAAWSQLDPRLVTQCHKDWEGVVVATSEELDWHDVVELGTV